MPFSPSRIPCLHLFPYSAFYKYFNTYTTLLHLLEQMFHLLGYTRYTRTKANLDNHCINNIQCRHTIVEFNTHYEKIRQSIISFFRAGLSDRHLHNFHGFTKSEQRWRECVTLSVTGIQDNLVYDWLHL